MIDDQIYAEVSNGKTVEFYLDTNVHKLGLFGDFSGRNSEKVRIKSNELLIPSGDKSYTYMIDTNAGLFENELILGEMSF